MKLAVGLLLNRCVFTGIYDTNYSFTDFGYGTGSSGVWHWLLRGMALAPQGYDINSAGVEVNRDSQRTFNRPEANLQHTLMRLSSKVCSAVINSASLHLVSGTAICRL